MTNLNNDQTYKTILETLLKALAKHPEFSEIKEMVDSHMPANAAGRVKEILARQEALHEAMNPENFDPITGMWLAAPGSAEDVIHIPEVKRSAPQSDDLFIMIPGLTDSGGSDDDDDFSVITY